MSGKYTVELTATAESVYRRIYEEAQACIKVGDISNSKVTLLRMIDDALDNLIPHDPFDPARALSGPLSNIFRIKKGRTRICYIGFQATQNRCPLHFGHAAKAGRCS